jgi:hypothetical protein
VKRFAVHQQPFCRLCLSLREKYNVIILEMFPGGFAIKAILTDDFCNLAILFWG